ncbi:PhnA domain-containing protein [Mucilaginibacter psychrotolerans]|uniref:Protein YjdM C-terminal domain-containing protein n=1 Tax=Mucilaginibacter psychrotolerans TaxID=1524096 RepID=A0A4Y8SBL3_9SPHI|nr:PhnA domain-containing protein [Mucilaginibacter psychrotolerans]TFF36513.1 hypothetical protein E2R66_15260 [Mucilaginibacter psychrotolerans]
MRDFIVKDSNGNQLNNGDSVTLIKSLKPKGCSSTLKQGMLVKKSDQRVVRKLIVR